VQHNLTVTPHGSPQVPGPVSNAPTPLRGLVQARQSAILLMILQTLGRHKWAILATTIVGLLGGLAATLLTPPTYRASVRLAFDPNGTSDTDISERSGSSSRRDTTDPLYDFTSVGLLKARSLAERVVRELKLDESPEFAPQTLPRATRQKVAVSTIQRNVEVVQQRATRLVDINYLAKDPQVAAAVANSLANSFIQSAIDRQLDKSSYARRYLRDQLEQMRQRLEASERALVAYERQRQMVTIQRAAADGNSTSQSINNADLGDIVTQLAEARQRRIRAEAQYRSQINLPAGARQTAAAGQLQGNLATARAKLADLRSIFKPDYPEVVALQNQITALERELSRTGSNDLSQLAAEYRAAAGEERALQGRLNQLRNSVLTERAGSTQYTVLTRDVETNRALYDALLQKYKVVGVTGTVGDSNVSIIDQAQPPSGPVSPILLLNLGIGLIAGLFLGATGAFAYDMMRDMINGPRDLEDRLNMKALGAIPYDSDHDDIMTALDNPRSLVTEGYFTVANQLRFATPHGIPRTLLLTSTIPGEGKSSSTYGIARSVARMGKRVLVVDADLRRPTFRMTADRYSGVGLVHLLTEQATVEECILRGPHGIDFVLAGGTPPNPSELFASGKVAGIIEALAERYDMVIVDGPPLLGLADSPLLASFVEATLLVFESGKIRSTYAQSSVDKLRNAGANLIGGIVTKFAKKNDEYGYSYGYGYGDKYGYRYDTDTKISAGEAKRRNIVLEDQREGA